MSTSVVRAATKVVAAVAVVGLVASGPAATAKPPVKAGAPTDLAVAVSAASNGRYELDSTWKPGANTTSFKVNVTNAAGTVLDSATVTPPAWTAFVKVPAGTALKVTVTAYNGTRKGAAAAKSVVTPDLTAPTGSFTGSSDQYVGSIHQTALADDVSPVSAIKRTVDWGDGSTPAAWTTAGDLTHTYAKAGQYVATVTLADEAGNTRRIDVPITVKDQTAPTGTFAGSSDKFDGVLHQVALADDVSPASAIKRTVDWGDGSTPEAWTTDADLSHTYTEQKRYVATVTLVDEAGNSAAVAVPIVINDHAAPTAAYSVATATAWAKLTQVVLHEDAIGDDFSPADTIKRVVAWGDGTTSAWTGPVAPTHVYQTANTYTPVVTVTDESGNKASFTSTSSTTVTADTAGPTVKLTLPGKRKRASAAAWSLVKGSAVDAGVGVAKVSVVAVEKRARGWYAYVPATKKWVRAGTTQKAAFRKAKAGVATLGSTGRWSAPLGKVAVGTLVYRVTATDLVGNAAPVVSKTQKITRR
jgi:hypothetical protein